MKPQTLEELEEELRLLNNLYENQPDTNKREIISFSIIEKENEIKHFKEWHVEEMHEFVKWIAKDESAAQKFRLIANELLAKLEG